MREEKPLIFEIDDSRMRRVRVAGNLADNSHRSVGSTDVIGYSVGNLFGPLTGVGQVVLAIILMHPRRLGEVGYIDAMDVAVNLNHVVLQFGVVTLAVAPNNIRCTVIVDENSWVDACPTVL